MANRFQVRPAEVPLLHPQEQVFTAMLDGWRNQQLAVNLAFATIEKKETMDRRVGCSAPDTRQPSK
jgi:hypothetical protein